MAARQDIINKAHGSGVCALFLPKDTFNCLEDQPEGVEEYKAIANATGGLHIDSGFTFSQFALVYSSHQCKYVIDPRISKEMYLNKKIVMSFVSQACLNF